MYTKIVEPWLSGHSQKGPPLYENSLISASGDEDKEDEDKKEPGTKSSYGRFAVEASVLTNIMIPYSWYSHSMMYCIPQIHLKMMLVTIPAPPNCPVTPKNPLIETRRPLTEVHWGL